MSRPTLNEQIEALEELRIDILFETEEVEDKAISAEAEQYFLMGLSQLDVAIRALRLASIKLSK